MENQRIADHLDDIADLLELEDSSEFRVRAYRAAARRVLKALRANRNERDGQH